jgi:ferredoxin
VPKITFGDRTITCADETTLREALRREGLTPHGGRSQWLNCTGIGSCGTCAVEIRGEVGPLTAMERWRLSFPPHDPARGLRLACQVKVTSDLVVIKHPGFWGQRVDEPGDD